MGKKESLQEKRQKMAEKRRRLRRRMRSCAQDILCSPNFRRSAAFCQHGRISVRSHSLMVAECSLQIRQKLLRLGIECRERELVRGALLHDYFLYDWHVKDKTHRLHGFFRIADPLNGWQFVKKDVFWQSFAAMGQRAVAVVPSAAE